MDEALACLQAVIFTNELGFRRVVFKGDSLTVIRRVFVLISDNSAISPVIHDIREAIKELKSVVFNFVHREVNNAARLPRFWIEKAPPGATSAAVLDWEKLNVN
ncbi:hypothetical protein V6N13_125667 [Hibiscus sabdariffa]|uniref:RNase H type-1 domain-containing protein n=1 Tax=Hibiscus sabdariffa TaxID=183260 RepID=A0ABR2U697_9ROSI